MNDEIIKCYNCGNKFIKKIIIWPCNCDDKRDSYYCCPYCDSTYEIRLMQNEDVKNCKIKEE